MEKNIKDISLNKNKLLSLIDNMKDKKCPFCEKTFKKNIDVKNHIIIKCFMDNQNKNNNNNNNNNNDDQSINMNFTSNNIINNTTINNNQTINITQNITIDLKNPIPFNEKWLIDHLNQKDKDYLMVTKYKFSELLELILKNNNNLNVIVDSNNNNSYGLIYKNEQEKYVSMNLDLICDETMKELRDLLYYDIIKNGYGGNNNLSSQINDTFLLRERADLNMKYENYNNNDFDIKKIVNNHLIKIFDEFKEKSYKIFNEIINPNKDLIDKEIDNSILLNEINEGQIKGF
jgi:hypothetical protein